MYFLCLYPSCDLQKCWCYILVSFMLSYRVHSSSVPLFSLFPFFSTYVSIFFVIHYSVSVTACKKKVKDRKHQEILSASKDDAESSEKEGNKKPKATKSSPVPVACKHRVYLYLIYYLFVFLISVFCHVPFPFNLIINIPLLGQQVRRRIRNRRRVQKTKVSIYFPLCITYVMFCSSQLFI